MELQLDDLYSICLLFFFGFKRKNSSIFYVVCCVLYAVCCIILFFIRRRRIERVIKRLITSSGVYLLREMKRTLAFIDGNLKFLLQLFFRFVIWQF
jgi:hypothetical protein